MDSFVSLLFIVSIWRSLMAALASPPDLLASVFMATSSYVMFSCFAMSFRISVVAR